MKQLVNGRYVEMTAEEIAAQQAAVIEEPAAVQTVEALLLEMAQAMSTCTSIAQIRAAAKAIVEKTEGAG